MGVGSSARRSVYSLSRPARALRALRALHGTLKNAGGNTNGLGATFLVGAGSVTPAGPTASTVNVRNGGAIIDTNGSDVTIGQALTHSAIGGETQEV